MYWDGVWSVCTPVCACLYMRTTSVSPYLLSSVCFKRHMCIVKWHNYLWGADKREPNTDTGFFLEWYQDGRSISQCSDFEHNARNFEMHTTWRRLETMFIPLGVSLLGSLQPPPEPKMRNGPTGPVTVHYYKTWPKQVRVSWYILPPLKTLFPPLMTVVPIWPHTKRQFYSRNSIYLFYSSSFFDSWKLTTNYCNVRSLHYDNLHKDLSNLRFLYAWLLLLQF